MGWITAYNLIEQLIESEEFKRKNGKSNPNDPASALSLALKKLYNKYNVHGHKI
jgi:hypothetical protein